MANDNDVAADLAAAVREYAGRGQCARVCGGDSKRFLGEPSGADLPVLDVTAHRGIISYEPKELVLRARAGTPIAALNAALAEAGQMLGFEPPDYDGRATLGGTIAAAMSGPRRPWSGAARDFVLGVGLITGEGHHLGFGGQVMKNVAGFDVSRLVVGSMGTLGIITEVSLKVLPAPQQQLTLVQELDVAAAHRTMLALSNQSLPLSGTCYLEGRLYVRFAGSAAAVRVAVERTGGEVATRDVWRDAAHFKLAPLAAAQRLWRVSVPQAATELLRESAVIEWGGSQRWLVDPGFDPRQRLSAGHATLVRAPADDSEPRFQPLTPALKQIHERLKHTFDPAGVFEPGRLYRRN